MYMTKEKKLPEKIRAFVVTQWNMDCDYQALIDKKQFQFIAYGEEICPTSGTPHHQMFVYFANPRSWKTKNLNKIGDMFGPIHCRVDAMFGSFEQNESYCSKEMDGKLIKFGKEPNQGERMDLTDLKDAILKGDMSADDVAVENPYMFHQYGRTLDRIEAIGLRKKFRTEFTKGIWIHGVTGSGKSHTAFSDYNPETHYVKNLNEDWWDGYKGQETVIFNEFRGQVTFSELLDLCDKWPKTVKWRSHEPVPFISKKLIITSIKSPKDCYSSVKDEPWEQFERRFEIIELEQKYSEGNIRTSEPVLEDFL